MMSRVYKVIVSGACALVVFSVAALLQVSAEQPLRIMALGDSVTVGYTDNPEWEQPFNFGYRSGLYERLTNAGYQFQFVGASPEPWESPWPPPAGNPSPDLRQLQMDQHRGYTGWKIEQIHQNVVEWMKLDRPELILLMIGINGINTESEEKLDALVKTIFETDQEVKLIVAQITPLAHYNQTLHDYNSYIKETLVPNYAQKGRVISTVDLYRDFLADHADPKSIEIDKLANRINHPTNELYDQIAERWFNEIKNLLGANH